MAQQIRTELVRQLAATLDNLPYGFFTDVFGGGYSKSMGYVSPQVWGNASYVVWVAVAMIESCKLTRTESYAMIDASTELDDDDRRKLRGFACGFLVYSMGSFDAKYTRRAG